MQSAAPPNAGSPSNPPDRSVPPGRADAPRAAPPSTARSLGIVPRLSEAMPLDAIVPNVPYLIVDQLNRVFMPDGNLTPGSGSFFGPYADYPGDMVGVSFDVDPTTANAKLSLGPPNANQYLHAYTKSTSFSWVFWGTSGFDSEYWVVNLKAVPGPQKNTFRLQGTKMGLCADGGIWNWGYVGDLATYTPLTLSIRKFYLSWSDLQQLFAATWQSAKIDAQSFRTTDPAYELIDSKKVSAIRTASGLANYKYIAEVFDCDDFSYVLKGQASIQAYADCGGKKDSVPNRSYALGVIRAHSVNVGHVANVFVDLSGNVNVLEPQTGAIVPGSAWVDNKGAPYIPDFICF